MGCPGVLEGCRSRLALLLAGLVLGWSCCDGAAPEPAATLQELDRRFDGHVRSFLGTHCLGCHGEGGDPEAGLDLGMLTSTEMLLEQERFLGPLIKVLEQGLMPPESESPRPSADDLQQVAAWFRDVRRHGIERAAGDPGIVLARRLSHAEYDNAIRDLTGVDLRPTREFPVDPTNTAGFGNSGETLVMSSTLLRKYLAAAREVADAMYLDRRGISFAPHAMIAATDRDSFVVHRIIDFYRRFNLDYAAYFAAAWEYRHREASGDPEATLEGIAERRGLSRRYLRAVWQALVEEPEDVGPLAKVRELFDSLPGPERPAEARAGCDAIGQHVVTVRGKLEPRFFNLEAGSLDVRTQPFLLWRHHQYATHRRSFDDRHLQIDGRLNPSEKPAEDGGGEFGPGLTPIVENVEGDPDLFVPGEEFERQRAAFARFCSLFPDRFVREERGRNAFDTTKDRGRYLSAGFHSKLGYFRDDAPLSELILDESERAELDELWLELEFVANASERSLREYLGGASGIRRRMLAAAAAGAGDVGAEVPGDVQQEATIEAIRDWMLAQAGDHDEARRAIAWYFDGKNRVIRGMERLHAEAEPAHVAAVVAFAARAFRRPLAGQEQQAIEDFYRTLRQGDRMNHEAAIRESIVAILMAPDFLYVVPTGGRDAGRVARGDESQAARIEPLTDFELASRLSFFLWSSLPDETLLTRAAAGELQHPEVLAAEARRMLGDVRIRSLAVEFGAAWLDVRRFLVENTVDVGRFPAFTPELQAAMFEEPIRFLLDVIERNGSVLEFLDGDFTFVNAPLAKHYGMPAAGLTTANWQRIDAAARYDRGGILPMAVFQTRHSPGRRTSPVKRGNWVVKTVLGEEIPAPPAVVPELPDDEAESDLPLRELLARHRSDPNCAACHARFDSYGLVFEGFGPIGERRTADLGGRPIDASAPFPGGLELEGVAGLRAFIRENRQDEFIRNLVGKMLAFALGRSLILSDQQLIGSIQQELASSGHRFDTLVVRIVTSPQFRTRRVAGGPPDDGSPPEAR